MKLKKILLSIVMLAMFCTIIIGQSISVQAAQATTPIYLGITELMSNNTPYMGYSIGNPVANSSTNIDAAKIWNIVKYSNSSGSNPTDSAIYCLKAGVGFSDTKKSETYNVYYDMKTEKTAIANQNTTLAGIVNGGHYNEILALLDLFYVKGESDASYKNTLLKTAGVYHEDEWDNEWDFILNEDDVKAIQQAALWYFTNSENASLFDKTSKDASNWLYYTTANKLDSNGKYEYSVLSSYNLEDEEGRQKVAQADILYKYLIKTAKENAASVSSSTSEQPITISNGKVTYEESGSNYVFGPINTTKVNNTPYTVDMSIKCGNTAITDYTLLNESKGSTSKSLHDLMGTNFYISIPKDKVTSMEDLRIDFSGSYSTTTMTLWGSSTNNSAQPVVIPKKENKLIQATLRPNMPDNKEFDLALRKYITKVNEKEVNNTRVPNIDVATLSNGGTTASYKHRKDPVIVEENNTVTYKLTIYNEGEKAGRATQVTDQLPAGLEFVSVDSGNFERESYDTTTNKLVLKRKNGNNTNLSAYTSGEPKSETIEITCRVTAKPDTSKNKVLTNIAWISQAIDEENKTIDRDSQTSTSPNKSANELVTEDNGYTGNNNKSVLTDSGYYYKGQQDDDDFEKIVLLPESFDLKLTKRITQVNGNDVAERIKSVDVSKLNTLDSNGNLITTGDYDLNKNAVKVRKDDIVTYTFRIYNEGTIDGYASEITEDIPEGLEFLWSDKTGTELRNDTTLTDAEKSAIEYNQELLWGKFVYNDDRTKIVQISTDYLSKTNETTENGNLIRAFGRNDGTKTTNDISYKEVSVKLKVVSETAVGSVIRNEAAITGDTDKDGNEIDDRDSQTDRWVKYEDDEDYDNIVLDETPEFDLALRKFIIAVSKDTTIENNEYLKNSDGSYTRAPVVDTSKLNTTDANGKLITTAEYNHTKEPVTVKKGDIVIYMLRVYNEGEIDGYAAEIRDSLPPYLEFVEGEFNTQYGWNPENDRVIKTTYLENQKINKIATNSNGSIVLNYKEVPIMCRVKDTAKENENITNIADITVYLDENKESIEDRDSFEGDVILPSDSNLPTYKDDETGSYIPGQQDDDDFEKVIIQPKVFDLALRKFIVAVSEDTTIEDSEYLKNTDGTYTREPVVDTSKLNTTDSNGKLITTATYTHSKEPLLVKKNDIVIYMLRVYNEGEEDGYAAEIKDHLPPYLEFVDGDFNKKYGWEKVDDRTVKTTYLKDKLINKPTTIKATTADGIAENGQKYVLSYQEVPIMCKVKDTAKTNENITNIADITKYLDENKNDVEDRDSDDNNVKLPDDKDLPGYNKSQEDDDDFEKVIVKEFDLALRKWVTQAIVIENGQQSVKNTGHKPYDDPEQVVKVELNRKKVNQVTVKFKYSIRVINEGDVEGYAKEVTDYIPQGLKFVAADNPNWKDEGNNIISTRQLENTLLKPGEYADVEVILTWINGEANMGVKTNIAEISEDYNKYGLPDKDSTPDNKKSGEDDIDDAPVMLSISTGQVRVFFTLGFVILFTIAGGITLIKKYVL